MFQRPGIPELDGSGVQFNIKYLGAVPINAPMHEMTHDLRKLLVSECIALVASKLGIIEPKPVNEVISKMIDSPEIKNINVDFNIRYKAFSIINMDNPSNPKFGSLIARHPVNCFSFAAQGEKDTPLEKMFGYVGKKTDGSNRKCFIFQHDNILKILSVMHEAVRQSPTEENAPTPSSTNLPQANPFTQETSNTNQITEQSTNFDEIQRIHMELMNYSWYHGSLERSEAEAMVQFNGDFLVRESKSKFVLTAKTDRFVHLLLKDALGRVKTHEREFSSIPELINHYLNNQQPIHQPTLENMNDALLRLKHPIPRQTRP